jgi:PAS domain S-box-containing protein
MSDFDRTEQSDMDELKRELAEQKELVRHLSFELGERTKELRCHNDITLLLQDAEMEPADFLQKVVVILSRAFQFPDIASACLRVFGREYKTQGFEACTVSLGVDIVKHGTVIGALEVCYRTGGVERTSGWFLSEEKDLLNAVAQRVAKYIERAELESVIHEKDRLHQSIMDFSPDVITITNLEGIIEYSSGKALEMFSGRHADDLINRPVLDFIDPCDHARAVDAITDMLNGNIRGAEEYRAVRLDGTSFDIEVNGELLRDVEGKTHKLLFVTRNITRRKDAERKLAETETLYRRMVESINDVLYEISTDGTIKYVSPVIRKILGYEPEEVTGRNIFDFMHPEDIPMVKKALGELSPGSYTSLHYRYFARDGSVKWIRSSTEPVIENGVMAGGRGTLTDIHTQKLAELALRESENRLRWLFEKMPQGVLYSDASMQITASNPAVERILRFPPDDFDKDVPPEGHLEVYREDGTFMAPDDYPSRMALRTGKPVRDEVLRFFYPATDESLWMLISAEPEFREGEEKPCRVFTTFTDITGLKETEKELTAQKTYNESLLAAIPDLIFILNHSGDIVEFKTGREEELAMPPEVFLNRNISEVLPVELCGKISDRLGELLAGKTGDPIQYEMVVGDKPGYYEARLSRFGDDKFIVLVSNISWRVKADKALRDSEEKYRSLIDSSDAVIFMLDPGGYYLFMNKIGAQPFGLKPEDVVGKNVRDLFPPDEAEQIAGHVARVMAINEGLVLEEEIHVAGEKRWYRTSMQPVRNEAGIPFAVMMYATNITEMKIAEIKIRQSEENYRTLFYNAPDGYLIFRDGRFVDCNKVAEEMIGYARSELIGKTPVMISPEYQPNGKKSEDYVVEVVGETFVKGNHSFEWIHRRSDGRDILVQVKSAVMNLDKEQVLIVSWRDITEQKKIARAIEESEARMRVITDSAIDAIVMLDHEGNVSFWNPAAEKIFGYTREEMVGHNFHLVATSHRDYESFRRAFPHFQQTGEGEAVGRLVELEAFHRNGGQLTVELSLSSIKVGDKWHAIGIMRDITERKAAEEELRKFRTVSDQANYGIVITSLDGIMLYCNSTFAQMHGWKAEDCPGRHISIFSSKEQMLHAEECMRMIKTQGGFTAKELWRTRKDGSVFPILISGTLIRDDDGSPKYMAATAIDITDRLAAEEELRKFRSISDQANYGNAIASLDGILLYSNDAFAHMHGWEVEDIIGRSLSMLHSEEQMAAVAEAIQILKSRGEFTALEIWRTRKDGTAFPSLMNAKVMTDSAGRHQFMSATVIDITEIKEKERAILESEERLNYAQELASMGSWELDLHNGDVSWSRNYYRLIGEDPSMPPLSLEEMKKRIHAEDREFFELELQNMEQKQTSGKVIFRLMMPGGEIKWIRANIMPHFDGDRLVSVRGISLDITERMEKEAEIRKLSMAIEQSPVVFLIKDLDGIITYASPAFLSLTGYSSDEINGQHISILWSDRTGDELYDQLWRTIKAGRTWQGEWFSRKKSGEEYPERVTISPILDERGHIISFLSIKEDLTIRKKVQQEQVARQAAEQANRAKSIFLANMSHEIRTPLNAIIGFSQILKRDDAMPANQREQVQTILKSGEHLLSLINDVLDLSKIEAGHMRLSNTDFCLHDLLDSLETMFRLRVRDKGLQLFIERNQSVPKYINSDEGKLRQILINLIGNAIKFTKEGTVTARFLAEEVPGLDEDYCAEGDLCLHLKVEIEDTGPGISDEDLAGIFESFYQSEAGREAGGTGLGLTISRSLVEMMGGRISVESRLGEGSIFRFHVPVKLGRDVVSHREPAFTENIVGLSPGTGPFRILAVDDNVDNLNLLRALLEPLGFQVKMAGNGLDGLKAFIEWSPHAVLMDMRMPVMDGYEAIRKIKSTLNGRATLVIALTASAFEEQKDKVMATGANDYLRKPFRREALLMKLGKIPGLQYVYKDYDGVPDDISGEGLPTADEVAALPEQIVSSMREAIEMGNMTRLRSLVAETEKINSQTAMKLLALVKQYDYEKLGELLGMKGDRDHGK